MRQAQSYHPREEAIQGIVRQKWIDLESIAKDQVMVDLREESFTNLGSQGTRRSRSLLDRSPIDVYCYPMI